MRLQCNLPAHLTYCLNIHPGESLDQVLAAIQGPAREIRKAIAPNRPFGLGLRLSDLVSRELQQSERFETFKGVLQQENFYIFTINGFPFGTFHDKPVKTDVYRPDWREMERYEYTLRLARLMSAFDLPDGFGSISTVPGSYKRWINNEGDIDLMVEKFVMLAAALHNLHLESGSAICVALEPEPDCFLETSADCVDFFKEKMFRTCAKRLAEKIKISAEKAEEIVRTHIGICLDTCHMALQYEDPLESLDRIVSAGISVAKIQISAALKTRLNADSRAALMAFNDPVYLHQVIERNAHGIFARGDLSDALKENQLSENCEWRIHFHVPLFWSGTDLIESTASGINSAFLQRAVLLGIKHFEIETYTFNVLPNLMRTDGVAHCVANEFNWVLTKEFI